MKYKIEFCDVFEDEGKNLPALYSAWHDPFFMRTVAEMHSVIPYQIQVYKSEELIGIMPVYERRRMGAKALVAPVGTYYQGLSTFFLPQTSQPRMTLDTITISERIAEFLTENYRRVNIRLNPGNVDVRGFTWHGVKARPLYTFSQYRDAEPFVLPEERRYLRKAERAGLELKEEYDLESFLALQKDLDTRKGHKMGVSYEKLGRYLDALYEKGMIKQFNVYQEDEIILAAIMFWGGNEIIYTLYIAGSEASLPLGASALQNRMTLSLLPEEITISDFCGANIRDVARFKAAMGLSLSVFYQLSIG